MRKLHDLHAVDYSSTDPECRAPTLAQDPVDGEQGSTSNKPQPHPAADVPPETLHLHVRNLQTSLEQNEDQEVSPIKLLVSVDTWALKNTWTECSSNWCENVPWLDPTATLLLLFLKKFRWHNSGCKCSRQIPERILRLLFRLKTRVGSKREWRMQRDLSQDVPRIQGWGI